MVVDAVDARFSSAKSRAFATRIAISALLLAGLVGCGGSQEQSTFLVAIWFATASPAQSSDVTKPPPIPKAAGQFSAARLTRPPLIDGREWIAVDVATASSLGTAPLQTQAFALTSRDCGDHGGDLERCQLLFQRGRATPPVRG